MSPSVPVVRHFPRAAWLVAVAFAWLWAWRHLSIEWRANEQYHYGFGVPFLLVYIAWQRWRGPMRSARVIFPALAAGAAWLLFACGEILRIHDPLWRMTGGLLVSGATLLSIAWLAAAGGLPLLRREAFALAFAWLALPWPMPLEKAVVHGLLSMLTGTVVWLLNLAGFAALQHGNIIEVSAGLIGMEEACSGVESLQAGFMASVFLGEFFRATVPARLGLVAAGGLIMTLTNFLRVLVLAFLTARHGTESAASWHDWIGGVATALAFGGLGLLASRLRGDQQRGMPVKNETPSPSPSSRLAGLASAIAFLAIPFVMASVFSPAPGAAPSAAPSLTVRSSAAPDGWSIRTGEITARQQALLQFSEGSSISVRTPSGLIAQVLRLFWKPSFTMPLFAHQHTPALCMPSAGWTSVGGAEQLTLTVHGRRVVCAAYRFTQENKSLVALQALFCNGVSQSAVGEPRDARRLRRIAELWEGLKQPGMNEELLLYMPATGGTEQLRRDATEILEAVFDPAAPRHAPAP